MKSLTIKIMEQELNIAAILKDKPKGTKLWSDTFGKAELWRVSEDNYPIKIALLNGNVIDLTKEGKYFKDIEDCQYCIFPSKSMRDWSKLTWKKGDVLKRNTKKGNTCIFVRFTSDDYTTFEGMYSESQIGSYCNTNEWQIVKNEQKIKDIVYRIEKQYHGKLNLETLEIEKPLFKDGDIVTIHKKDCDITFIFNRMKTKDSFYYYAFHTYNENNTGIIDERISLPYEWTYIDGKISPATDSEKKQLFAALEKEGKEWDADKKQIVDLPKKYEFKPLDYILIKVKGFDSKWLLMQYSFTKDNNLYVIGGFVYSLNDLTILPYNNQTAHLLGTTDDWKGGE